MHDLSINQALIPIARTNKNTASLSSVSREFTERQNFLGNILLSLSFFLIIAAPLYARWAVATQLVMVLSGIILTLFGRYSERVLILLFGLFFYTLIIIIANGGDSLRLGVISAIFYGLFFTNSRVYSFILIASLFVIGNLLYSNTEGFTHMVNIYKSVAEGESFNYFAEALFYVLIAGILTESIGRSRNLAFAILTASIFTGFFVPSRQIAIVAMCAATYFILTGGHAGIKITIGISIVAILLHFVDYHDLVFVDKFIDRGVASLRSQILDCYVSNFSPSDLFIGSDKTESGMCAMNLIDVKYLHNGFLEMQSELGLLGFIMIILYPLSIIYFAIKSNLKVVLVLIFVGIYQMVEGGFMWIYFFILFKIMEDIWRSPATNRSMHT